MVVGYFLIIATVITADADDRAKMESFDVNRNGRIEDSERTEEARRAILDQGQDTGRALAHILGIPLTVVWYAFLFGILYGGEWAIKRLFFRSHISRNAIAHPDHGSG
jgi:hypothetical protein